MQELAQVGCGNPGGREAIAHTCRHRMGLQASGEPRALAQSDCVSASTAAERHEVLAATRALTRSLAQRVPWTCSSRVQQRRVRTARLGCLECVNSHGKGYNEGYGDGKTDGEDCVDSNGYGEDNADHEACGDGKDYSGDGKRACCDGDGYWRRGYASRS